jgi:tol-pal system protein YbgF
LPFCEINKDSIMQFNLKLKKILIPILFLFLINYVYAEEEEIYLKSISDQIQVITKDLKTLEKAVYQKSDLISAKPSSSTSSAGLNEDIMTKHLLKLNEIEDQFRELTNKFEEVNFKLDKLSTRVTKIQSDTQLRFSDLETGTDNTVKEKKILPGSTKPQDFGAAPAYQTSNLPKRQSINSVESAKTVIAEEPEKKESLLPDKPADEQYEFAVSFMKIGDYETAEFALKEFIDKNKDHDLAGSAQYWYGETFRIRQLYSDAATAYLDGYQNYPKSSKAPDNLLKLGITMVQLGEKDQGCKMILGIKKEYPKANKSVLQKAQYEQKKFKCKS